MDNGHSGRLASRGRVISLILLTGALSMRPAAAASDDQSRRDDGGGVAVAGGATQLGTVSVDGRYPGAESPTAGYTAHSIRGATKADAPQLETPQTVDVVTRQQITDQGSRNINQALRYTPGCSPGWPAPRAGRMSRRCAGFPVAMSTTRFWTGCA